MSLINISNLTFAYEGSYNNVFEDVNFHIDTNWRLGFTGRNGRGKTTFLKLLMKEYEYSGTITGHTDFEYFPYDVSDPNRLAIDVIRGVSHDALDWEIMRELSFLDMQEEALYQPFCTLSNGEQTKALLAGLFLREDSFLLIDEPTNHLDAAARKVLSNYLKKKSGFILVSHDRTFLDHCVDHILAINKTNIQVQKGNFSSWWHNKEMQDRFEFAENEKIKKDISRLKAASQKTAAWSARTEKRKHGKADSGIKLDKGFVGHKAAKMMQRSKNIENRQQALIEDQTKLLKDIENQSPLKISPLRYHSRRLAEFSDLSIVFGEKVICSGINFAIEQGDKIALQGKNGSGKSCLLKLLYGEEIAYTGILRKNNNLKISYIPQGTSALQGSLTDYVAYHNIDESLFKAILRKLDFHRDHFQQRLETFSEGQKKKVLIAKSLSEPAHLYIWDEPLNYIDVFSRMQIETLLTEYHPTILFVEHDDAFCNNIANKIIYL